MPTTILIVDDSLVDRMIIENMLQDYRVLTGCDGLEAIELLNTHPEIELVILDINMPNMNGFEVLTILKDNPKYSHVRVIILTNFDEVDNEVKGLQLGAVDYIRKPINMESLKVRIVIHLNLLRMQKIVESMYDEKNQLYNAIFHQAPVGISVAYYEVASDDKEAILINPKYEEIVGRSKAELIETGWASFTHPDDLEMDLQLFHQVIREEINHYSLEKRMIQPDGSIVWVYMVVANFKIGQQKKNICIMQDITKRKELEIALKKSEKSKSILLSHLPGIVYRINFENNLKIEYLSENCFDLTGFTAKELMANPDIYFFHLIKENHRVLLDKKRESDLENKIPYEYEYEIITGTKESKWVLELGQGIYNEDGVLEAAEGMILDIHDRKIMENRLKFFNDHDEWTGLYNQKYLLKLLEKEQSKTVPYNRALIGINASMLHLLAITYGIQYSLELVKKIASQLLKLCGDTVKLFHTNEYRFAFFLNYHYTTQELNDFCTTVSQILDGILGVERITAQLGVLEIQPDQFLPPEQLLRMMLITSEIEQDSKTANPFVRYFDSKMQEQVYRKEKIESEMNEIINTFHDERLFLLFHPILDIKTNKIHGFEALARMQSPELGIVSPVEFIPIAEKTKLIIPIGERIIQKSFQFLKELHKKGHKEMDISINISAIQLLSEGFYDRLIQTLEKEKINKNNVILEITESIFAPDYEEINTVLNQFREYGLQIAIDDFGKDYSSLARERELQLDYLKIDKYFIDKLITADANKIITGDIIAIGHRLGHRVIAEGIESKIQLEYLIQNDCDMIQGYYVSLPLTKEEALLFIEKYKK
ncbi:MAG: EAL domain-containing protein [Bacilli bacterium]|jgi:PAS domain S-box-containing protein|nr:EAL domain-containing protein [Bacilli bacterium]